MPYQIGTVDNTGSEGYAHWQMLLLIHHFAGGYGTLGAPTFAGTGTGSLTKLDTHPATVTETWTIQCTSAPSAGNEAWSVTGSVSGAKAAATTGVAYDNGLIAFTVAAGGTAFAVGDKFTVAATQGALSAIGRAWAVLRYVNPNDITQNRELILQGSGLSGTDQIFIGFRSYQSVSADYYNLSVAGFTGYVAGNSFVTQPGYRESGVCAHNLRIDYWLAVNGQRVAFGLKVGTPVYESGYAGKLLPYATPSQYPYPLFCGGMLSGVAATRYSDTTHSMYAKGARANAAMLFVDGTWHQPTTWPWSCPAYTGGTSGVNGALRDTGGNYQLLPIVLTEGDGTANANVYGELDGVRQISGFSNAVENMLQIGGSAVADNSGWTSAQRAAAIVAAGGTPWVVIQDVARTGFADYYALRLD